MNSGVFDIPAVLAILAVVVFVLVRAFASSRSDDLDMFMKRQTPGERTTR